MSSHRFSHIAVLLCCATQAVAAAEEENDTLSVNADISQTWDSNYNREPGSSSEQITRASLGTGINTTLSRQTLSASLGAARYRHNRRDFLDATLYRGGLGWRGPIGNRLSFALSWSYRDRLAERIDFVGKDVINLDEKNAAVKYAIFSGWALVGGARDAEQTHSNDDRESLDYEERDYSAGLQYTSGRKSTVTLKFTEGDRHYLHPGEGDVPGVDPQDDLDYDYQRMAFETEWQMTGKTKLTGTLGYFDRDGEVNSGNGLETSIQTDWAATDKTDLILIYAFDQPPVGEDSENPSEAHIVSARVAWEWTSKITVETAVRAAFQEYDDTLERVARDEKSYGWVPLLLRYQLNNAISVRFVSGWQQRESPIDERNYTAREFSLGLAGEF
ncbi:hypothetical protein [Marinobacter fonticola]|uniref:hypothetical protein n=1 Tax=Marinobacter fonticola TaxID=2603215 RepID=UPI0011E716F7|nr:hypothetical protein [Marinobacter fonticola]